MNYKNIFAQAFFLFIFLFTSSSLWAQPHGKLKYETMIEQGDLALEQGDYYSALDWFDQAYKDQKTLDIAIVIARLNYELKNYKMAEKRYKNLVKRDKNNQLIPEKLDYANTLKALGKYDLAIEQYLHFLQLTEDDEKKQFVYKELLGIKLLDSLPNNIEASIKPLSKEVNSKFSEYSPKEYVDGTLYFSSFLRDDVLILDGEEEDYHAKIYTSTMETEPDRKGNYNYSDPSPLSEEINRKEFHTSHMSFSNDGREMFFTRTLLDGNEVGNSQIFVSYFNDGEWTAPQLVSGVNGDWAAKHPSPGELFGNEVLFFSSSMDGGFGGDDIFYATKESDGVYSTPNNLGETINTKGDEVTPFYKDGTLYFSTNGHPTIGGFDIYYATWDGSNWDELSNMGHNYNTSLDDLYFSLNQSGTKGYLVSNRPYPKKKKLKSETCCDDIFSVEIRDIIIDLLAVVKDKDGPLIGSTVSLYDMSAEDFSQTRSEPNASDYNFLLDSDREYKVVVSKEGYFPDSLEFNTAGILDDYTVKKTITLNAKPKTKKDDQMELVTINQPIRLNNIYYDFDDDKILKDAELDLNTLFDLLNDYPDMVIELSSHTDSRGDKPYNEDLSQRRANSAKAWLVEKGIETDRVVPKGYGESVILNECKDGVNCDETKHRLNRRTEFKIIEGPQFIQIKKSIKKESPQGGSQNYQSKTNVPVIKFDKNNLDLGSIQKGEKKEVRYGFVNTGDGDLNIELVTACKCTSLNWTRGNIAPGERGEIIAVFDSGQVEAGKIEKTIDIIANTDPIVVEAFFVAEVIE
jgi:peptidoglycan-associated lipoprotein